VGFIVVERRSPEPLVDLELLEAPVIRVGLIVGTLSGIVMFGLTTFVPPMVQGVHRGTAIDAGVAVAAMSIGWPVGSVVGGRALIRLGSRRVVVVGTTMLVAGTLLVTQIGRFDALAFAMVASAVTGLGMGLTATTILVVIQGGVSWRRRATATGLVQFSRTIGGGVGVGIMGGILTAFVGAASSAILDPIARSSLDPATLDASRESLSGGLGVIYWIILVAAAGAWIVALRFMPDVRIGDQISAVEGG
jgi:predicted MFS family arabinose efflux permease